MIIAYLHNGSGDGYLALQVSELTLQEVTSPEWSVGVTCNESWWIVPGSPILDY